MLTIDWSTFARTGPPDPRWKPPRTFTIGGVWGFHVEWRDYSAGRVWGHWTPRPRKKDILKSRMASGKVGVFRFVDVEHLSDPDDMFFGTVEPLGYEDEL